eukprot:2624926-Karenia_brevis.AAC.1
MAAPSTQYTRQRITCGSVTLAASRWPRAKYYVLSMARFGRRRVKEEQHGISGSCNLARATA